MKLKTETSTISLIAMTSIGTMVSESWRSFLFSVLVANCFLWLSGLELRLIEGWKKFLHYRWNKYLTDDLKIKSSWKLWLGKVIFSRKCRNFFLPSLKEMFALIFYVIWAISLESQVENSILNSIFLRRLRQFGTWAACAGAEQSLSSLLGTFRLRWLLPVGL